MAASRPKTSKTTSAPVRLHVGRLAALVLLLVAAAFYVAPLRQFFSQQDRYLREVAVLQQAQAQNASLQEQVSRMRTRAYVTRQARQEFQLVPAGMQVFVVKGLSDKDVSGSERPAAPAVAKPSPLDRLRDLWRTLSK